MADVSRHDYDYNNDGIVDNEEYVVGHDTGIKADGVTEVDLNTLMGVAESDDGAWSPREVFLAMEKDQEEHETLLPDHVPGPCHAVAEYAVSPLEPWRLQWNVLVLGVVVYSCIEVPYAAAVTPYAETSLISYLVDLIFYADMVLNFFTGYDVGYEIVMVKRRIVFHYLKTWFVIDLLATVDWGVVLSSFFTPAELPGWVNMMALLKILRLARAGRLIDTLSSRWSAHSGFVEAGKFGLYVSIVAHLLSCFFFMWPVIIDENKLLVGSPECARDNATADDARYCIENGGIGADGTECDMFSAVGWYYANSCMQGSWREQQGLEQICLPEVCGERPVTGDWNWALDKSWNVPGFGGQGWDYVTECEDGSLPRPLTDNETKEALLMCLETADQGLHPTDPNWRVCPKCNRPMRLYLDSLYWSLTTMTTIGYGDRGPKTESEILYTLFAEVFGLAFFALLLTQINTVNELLGLQSADAKQTKDGILQFLSSRRVDSDLTEEIVRFLSFRNNSFSGNSMADVEQMEALSDGMRGRIRKAVYLPVLKEISIFGWKQQDEEEERNVKLFFDSIDESGDGRLDREEIGHLFKHLGLELSDEHFRLCYLEIDRDNEGSVDFKEFAWWWFKTKYGVPRAASGAKSPESFLSALAGNLRPKMFSAGDRLVKPREYGNEFVILLGGKLRILRPGVKPGLRGSHPDDENRVEKRDRIIASSERMPMFGLSACLTILQQELVCNRTDYWAVDAEEYCDTLWCPRKEFYACFTDHWLKGRDDMVEVCYHLYEVELILNAQTKIDADGDGKVSHEEFLEASADIPHGFASHFAEEKKALLQEAESKGHQVKGILDASSTRHQEQMEEDVNATAEALMDDADRLRFKVDKLSTVADGLSSEVASIKSGMRRLLSHHQQEWEEEERQKGSMSPSRSTRPIEFLPTTDTGSAGTFDVENYAKSELKKNR